MRVSTEDQAREGFSLPEQKERLEDYYKLDPENKMEEYQFGILYIDRDDYDDFEITNVENIEPYFNAIPDVNNMRVVYKKDEPVEIDVKPVKFSEKDST